MSASSRRATTPYRAFVELGSRLSRDTLLYAFGTTLSLPVGLVTTAVLTRHLHVSEFGQLAELFAFASVLTILLNMVFLQGPLLLVFLHSDDSTEMTAAQAAAVARHERPIMLTTGLAVTFVVGLAAVAVVAGLAAPLASLLTGHAAQAGAVRLAAASAATGSLWRYVTNVTRFEKRARSFAVWAAARPIVALAVTVPLIELGLGLRAALIGTAIGSLVSGAGALGVSRRSYALRIRLAFVGRAARTGLPWVAVVLGLYFAHSADLLLLRATASNAQLGVYRIADSLSQVISYGVSAFHLAQVPLDATLMSQAAYDEYSRDRVMAGYVLVYTIGAVLATLLLIALGATVISVVAPGYGAAVPYVPLTAMAYVAYGFLLTVFRAGDFFKRRTRAYGWTAGGAGLGVVVFALAGSRLIGVAGVPLGATLGCLLPSAVLLTLGQIKGHPLPIDYPRLTGALALGAVCWAPGAILGGGATGAATKLGGIAVFVLGLGVLRIIPRAQLRELRGLVGALLPGHRGSPALLAGLAALPDGQREALLAVVRDRADSATVAVRLGVEEVVVRRRVVAALRGLTGGTGDFPLDEQLGYYLISGDPPADLDAAMREFRRAGANMVEFRVMENVFQRLRRLPRRAFTEAVMSQRRPPDGAALGVPDGALQALARTGWDLAAAASERGERAPELAADALADLRRMAGCPGPRPFDQLIARFLLEPGSVGDTRSLWAAGVDPLELHRLELTLAAVRRRTPRRGRAPRRREQSVAAAAASEPVH
jgi:O-antigen/teichoic acid export membrane protein